MKTPTDGAGSYVHKVREGIQKYAQDLLAENDRLRILLATLESERSRLEERSRSTDDLLRELDVLRGVVARLEREKLRLQEQLLAARDELDGHRRDRAQLERQLSEVENDSRRFSEQFVQLEAQNSNLANLYVASYRLHGTLDRQEVLSAIQEIVANLIGSEELAVYELDPDGAALSLVASYGLAADDHARVPLGVGRIGRAAVTGAPDVGEALSDLQRPQEGDLTACIPLKLDGRVTGVIALFRLLPQKARFEAVDHELFDLLATHAASALYCSSLQARASAHPAS